MEWILITGCMQDSHLHVPVGMELIKIEACQLVKPYNAQFAASSGWLHKLIVRNGLS